MTTSKTINDITIKDISKVYSGKIGRCFCGYSGTYSYNPMYPTTEHQNVSARNVTRIFNIIKKNFDGEDRVVDNNVSIEIGSKVYMVCFTKEFLASAGIEQ